jgi:nucleoside-diphosphate-sugar epimerase
LKKVLITGANSYVGTNVEKWLMKEPENFYVETLDMKDPNWTSFDFSRFDVVFHVAGIVHKKVTKETKDLYYKVNQDLAIEVAEKSKKSGVKRFIFMSTMSVYGLNRGAIHNKTPLNPKTEYGKSKRNAEIEIETLQNENFKVAILRPPLIYGPNSIGNYVFLSNFVKKYKIFPKIDNKKSFIFIDHFCEFIKLIIFSNKSGIFHPQNSFLMSTTSMVEEIKKITKKKIIISKIFNFVLLFKFLNKVSKVFDSLYYDNTLYSDLETDMIQRSSILTFSETIQMTELPS